MYANRCTYSTTDTLVSNLNDIVPILKNMAYYMCIGIYLYLETIEIHHQLLDKYHPYKMKNI